MREWLKKHLLSSGFLIWFGFNIVFNFAPYFFLLPGGFFRSNMPSFTTYVTGGELLIIAVAIAADSTGAIILEKENKRSSRAKSSWLIIALVVLVIIIILASVAFVDVKFNQKELIPAQILKYSFSILLASFAVSLAARSYMENK
jgi:hypothetical protein